MVKGKIIKKGLKLIDEPLKKAKLGAGAVAVERATDIIDNPWLSAAEGAVIGGTIAGPWGAAAGGLIGFVLADGERIMPIDMIAIPAYQYSMMLQGKEPTFQIYIKEGELVTPIIPTDAQVSSAIVETITTTPKRKRSKGAGLPSKYAKMGFKKGWAKYKTTKAYKAKKARKKKSKRRRK